MKKCLIVLFSVLVLTSFVVAADVPSAAVGEEDVEELQGIIDQLPFDEGGEANFSRYKPFVTRAEERIDAINLWLDSNAGWMRYLFQMRPQVSLLFALNIYFILLFFLIMFLNAKGLWFFIESENKARVFGLAVFVIFAVIGLYAGLAYLVNNFFLYIWYILLPAAVWIAVAAMILFGGLLIFGLISVGAIAGAFTKYFARKKAFRERTEMAASSEAVNKLIEQATKK